MLWEHLQQTQTIRFDIALISILFTLGHIFFGHFEEKTPKWRKVVKFIVFLVLIVLISHYLGRGYVWGLIGILLLGVIYIHAVLLPKHGINGWTGEPKSKYYDFRGWNKDIFKDEN